MQTRLYFYGIWQTFIISANFYNDGGTKKPTPSVIAIGKFYDLYMPSCRRDIGPYVYGNFLE